MKNEEKEYQRIQGKSNNNNKHLWFYFLYKKLYFYRKHSLENNSLYHQNLFTAFICVAGYLKRSNDTKKINIHKYTNYNINTLGTAM